HGIACNSNGQATCRGRWWGEAITISCVPYSRQTEADRGSGMAADLQNIFVAKATSMVALGSAAFVVTMVPVLIGRRISSKHPPQIETRNTRMDFILSLFLSFGGGVLLCTTFLHLLPEVTKNIEHLQRKGKIPEDFPLPLPELIMCCGFFIMYIVEEVAHKILHSHHAKQGGTQDRDITLNISSAVLVDSEATLSEDYGHIIKQDLITVTFTPPREEDTKNISRDTKTHRSSCVSKREEDIHSHKHCHNRDHEEQSRDLHYDHDHQHHDHETGDHHTLVTTSPPSLRELLLVLALTVHEGFEGLAIGLESSVAAVWYLLAAVATHKCVLAFCIGIELVSGHISLPLSIFYAFIYSCASPFGIGMGLLMSTSDNDHLTELLSVLLQGVATGTLLYVVFFEILKRDNHGEAKLAQLIVVIAGFAGMAALTVLLNA
ncbi:hypothetical protein J6590_056300, partial [Homalodisca vitripennis]